ncbi:0befb940-6894-499f-888c-b3e503d4b58e [Sclerotinia trifoliorum]|uniref:0befb940-6894-499f-888c-b3e503d4b58e n=1 Tax=Sclerotinia trifoliorum TaxID=28548 RepID=A0A8H2ZSZ1_9HELO|nr:0befb940-6894-499f-888c-b3e503d4b58e [Sclerotinia trifoliorum]
MAKKKSKKATSKVKKGYHQKKDGPSDKGSTTEESTIISDADIQNALSNLTLQPDVSVPVTGTSSHASKQAESSQNSSSETANTAGVQEKKPTAAPPCAAEAGHGSNHSTRSQNSIKGLNEVMKEITDAKIPVFNFQGASTSRPSVDQLEKELHMDQLRVMCREYEEASEKSIAEIHKRNHEVLCKFGKWRAELILEAEKFDEMGRIFVLVD